VPATYEKIATTTLGSTSATITFSSIAASWTDLRLVLVWKPTSSASMNPFFRINNDSTTLYSETYLNGNGTAAASGRSTGAGQWTVNQVLNPSTSQFTFTTVDYFSYAGSTFKTALISTAADFNGSGYTQPQVGLYRSTTAITQINLVASSDSFAIGTTATLYGILKA
jgi:hypothetical protein